MGHPPRQAHPDEAISARGGVRDRQCDLHMGPNLLHLLHPLGERGRRLPRHARGARSRELQDRRMDHRRCDRHVRHGERHDWRADRDGCAQHAQAPAGPLRGPGLRGQCRDRARVPLLQGRLVTPLRRHQLLLHRPRGRDGVVHARHPRGAAQDRYRGRGLQCRVRPGPDRDQPALRPAHGDGRCDRLLQVHRAHRREAPRHQHHVHGQALPPRGG